MFLTNLKCLFITINDESISKKEIIFFWSWKKVIGI